MRICQVEGCNNKHRSGGFCQTHYDQDRHKRTRNNQEYKTYRKELNGDLMTPTYKSWMAMKQRCNNSNHHSYPIYGGRDIVYCKSWELYKNFLEDMGPRPEGMTLDRVDPDGNYEISNVRWATKKEQANNRRYM